MNINIDLWYRRYAAMVLRRCQFLLRDEEAAMDAMQEVFVQLVRKQSELKDQAPSSLLYTIATNHCLNVLKSKKHRYEYLHIVKNKSTDEDTLFTPDFASNDRSHEAFEARETLDQIFALQDDRTRTIAWLHYVDGLTLEETASASNMSLSGIRKRLSKLKGLAREYSEVHL